MIKKTIKKKHGIYGDFVVAMLEDRGVIELLNADIKTYFKTYRHIPDEIFSEFIKTVYLNDQRVHSILANNIVKEKHLGIGMGEFCYIITDITGLTQATIYKRIRDSENIIRLDVNNYKLVLPIFTEDELVLMRNKILQAKYNMNIDEMDLTSEHLTMFDDDLKNRDEIYAQI